MSFRVLIFQTLSEARFRLYQRRFLRPRSHFLAFFELYIFSFAPFQISLIFRTFAQFFAEFDAIFAEFQGRQQILQIFVKISPNIFRFSQNFSDFGWSDVKIMIFHKILRKFAEIMRNFLEKILKICPKKMYTLNRYGGNSLELQGLIL